MPLPSCGGPHPRKELISDNVRDSWSGAACSSRFAGVANDAPWSFDILHRPKGENRTAQGFSPGNQTHNEIALKGRPNRVAFDERHPWK